MVSILKRPSVTPSNPAQLFPQSPQSLFQTSSSSILPELQSETITSISPPSTPSENSLTSYFTENEARILSTSCLPPKLTCICILPPSSYLNPTRTPAQDSPDPQAPAPLIDSPLHPPTFLSTSSSHHHVNMPMLYHLEKKILLQTSCSVVLFFTDKQDLSHLHSPLY